MTYKDLTVAFAAIAVLLSPGMPGSLTAQSKTFFTSARHTLGTESNRSASVRLGDLDGDGDLDAVVANGRHWPQQNFVFFNQGKARFSVMRPLSADRATTYACELADLDGDGDLDVAIGNDMALGQILLNDGKGNFDQQSTFGEVTSVRSLAVADIDSDGDVDILATCRGRENRIYLNDGKANFKPGPTYGKQSDSTIDVAIGDVNHDGHQDLLLANRDGQPNVLLLNDGKLGFNTRQPFGSGKDESRAVATGDLNGDGKLDWVTGNIGQPNTVCLGDGKGGVLKSIDFGQPQGRTYAIAIADLDADGDLDIVAGNSGQAGAAFFNNGDATGFRQETFGDAHATYGLCVGDLNGDALPDVAVANSDALNFVFINRLKVPSVPVKALQAATKTYVSKTATKTQTGSGLVTQFRDDSFRKRPVYQTTDWPSFRGTGARGVAEGFPVRESWNAEAGKLDGVLWQTDVPGLGHSSPVVFGNKVFLITAVAKDGKSELEVNAGGKTAAADDGGEQDWIVLCYDKTNGKELWRKTAYRGQPRASRHTKATHANTSVCVDGKHVLAFLGSEGLHCYDMNGELLWTRDLGVIDVSKYGVGWGFASSPIIDGDRAVIVCDHPSDPYVAALSLADGKDIWRSPRQGICERSWGTPLVHADDKTTQVVVNGWPYILSYDLATGKELWRLKGGGDNPIPTPFEAHGWFYVTNAHGGPSPIFAIRPDSRGEVTLSNSSEGRSSEGRSPEGRSPEGRSNADAKKDSVVWSVPKGGSYMSTPVVYGDYIYLGNSNGVVRCFHAKTGAKVFEKRLGRGAGIISSLVASDGKIFCPSENGKVYVLKAGPEYEILASNKMGEPCFATPAISAGVIFIRTTNRLIAIK